MNLEKVNSWSGLVANICVIAGIGFLAVELNQNSQMMAAQTRAAVTQEILYLIEREQDAKVEVVLRKIRSAEELTQEEDDAAVYAMVARLRHWENVFYQYQNGLFDESEFQAISRAIERDLGHPYMQKVWAEQRFMYSESYQNLIDNFVSN